MKTNKIFIAGGAGYIGSALIPVLLDYGYDVTVMDLLWFGNSLPKSVNVIKKDLFQCTKKDLEGFDQIIFLAGISNDPSAEYDPVRNFLYNASLPSYLAYIGKRVGVKRMVYASTCSVYGYTVGRLFDEESTISCNYAYGVSKFQGEKGVMHLQDDSFSAISLRKGTVSGHSSRMRYDLIVNTMFMHAMTRGVITINNPSIWRPIVSIKDVVSAYLRAIQADYTISGVFNISYDNYTVGEVAYIVKDIIETHTDINVKLNIKNIEDVRNYKVSIDKAKTILGFHPRYSVADIVLELLDNWNKFSDRILDSNLYNIEICKQIFNKNEIVW